MLKELSQKELEAEKKLEAQNHQELQNDEYSKTETSAEDGVETITAIDEDDDQITKLNLLLQTSRYSKQTLHKLCTVHERESN